jgi:glycosyltransferase involved in cell wall biosynthesis
MIRVVHVEAGRHLFGGARQVLDLHAGLLDAGVDSQLVAPPDSEVLAEVLASGLPGMAMPMAGEVDLRMAVRLIRLLRDRPTAILHAHSRRGADIYGGIAARLAGHRAVLSRRIDRPERRFPGGLKYANYDAVVAVSQMIADQLQQVGVPASRIHVVHDAVDCQACKPTWSMQKFRDEFSLADGQVCVALAAQFIARKGHRDALAAWRQVIAKVPEARLVIFGRGPLDGEIRQLASTVDGVTVAGFRDDLRQFLGHFDVLLHPARREGLGVVVLEAQAAGIPVVAFRSGGIPEVVGHDQTGLFAAPGDLQELADALVAMLSDPARAASMGAAAARHAARYSVARMVEANLAVYRSIEPGGGGE